MQKIPLFSVITVSLDNLRGLQATGRSVLAQSCADREWIVIDGGSGDGSAAWLAQSGADFCVSEKDGGIFDAMNKGLARASGRWCLFLNAGDTLAAAETLAAMEALLERQAGAPAFIYGDALEDSGNGQCFYKRARPHAKIVGGMFTHHQAMLYRRDRLEGLRYDTRYRIAADYDFTCRFLLRTKDALYCPFAICVFESGGVSQKKALAGRLEELRIRSALGLVSRPACLVIFIRQTLAWLLRQVFPPLYRRLRFRERPASPRLRDDERYRSGPGG